MRVKSDPADDALARSAIESADPATAITGFEAIDRTLRGVLARDLMGAYIARATNAGYFPHIILGIAVMSIYVILFNRLLLRPLYGMAERRFRFD